MAKRGTRRGFSRSVNQWAQATEERSTDAYRNGLLDFYDELRAATPVDTGNLRDAWVASDSGNAMTVTGPGDSPGQSNNRSGISQSIAAIMSAKIGDKISFMNHATYFLRIERGFVGPDSLGRVYNQAGRWFAAGVGARYRAIMRRAATRLKMAMK